MDKRLQSWIKRHKLIVKEVARDLIFEVEGFATFLLIQPKEGKIIDDYCGLILSNEELEIYDRKEINYFLFQFGRSFYYCKKNLVTEGNEKEEITYFKAAFNEFKYLGKAEQQLEGDFCHLGVHGEYELLNGSKDASTWAKKGKFLGHKALGICDRNTLAGTLAFQGSCAKEDIKSVLGITVSIAYNYEEGKEHQEIYEGKVFCLNKVGWRNLLRIGKAINVDYDGLIPEEVLLEHGEGCVFVFSNNSKIRKIREKKEGVRHIMKYRKAFDLAFYQIDTVEYNSDNIFRQHLDAISFYLHNWCNLLEPILINDAYYLDADDYEVKKILNDVSRVVAPESSSQHFKTLDESYLSISRWFSDDEKEFANGETFDKLFDKMISNTSRIADLCDFKIDTGEHKLPKYPFTEDAEELFYNILSKGFKKKLKKIKNKEAYMERLEEEAGVIVGAGFVDYFLILWDIVDWAKRQHIIVGPGRGSVGGSLVAYLMDITEIDPIKFDLLFERFINKTRISGERAKQPDALPDIDVDFESARRDDVKRYVEDRFGKNNVCSIGTYARLKLKTSLKDFSRVKGIDFQFINKLTKDIDDQISYEWIDLFRYATQSKNLKSFIDINYDIIELTRLVLNQAKTPAIHPSAIVITPSEDKDGNPMTVFDWLPMKKIGTELVSEWEGKYIDKAGYLKEDILGIGQLDKFKSILSLIKKSTGEKIILEDIPFDNEEAFDLFEKGYNEGVFQFGSHGLKSYSIKVKPDSMEDLIAMNALYRPGPMDSGAHNDFADIKHGRKKPAFDYGLKGVTKKTHGLYIYQEQIMQAVNVLGGLTLSEADEVRTVMKKFDHNKMKSFEEKFLIGAVANGCKPKEAEKIWKKLQAFSGYGFNRSHSAAYAMIAYWCQWLKAEYPLQFWTTALQFAKEGSVPYIISEMLKASEHITIRTPDINISEKTFMMNKDDQSIYWSLEKIKGIGDATVSVLMDERKNGKFRSFDEFVRRVPKAKINRGVVTKFIVCGCFDKIENLDSPVDRLGLLRYYYASLGEEMPDIFLGSNAKTKFFWASLVREYTGFGFIDYKALANEVIENRYMSKYKTPKQFYECERQYTIATICGVVTKVMLRKTKKDNKEFGIVTLQSNFDEMTVIFWNEEWRRFGARITEELTGQVMAVFGKIRWDEYRNQNTLFAHENTKIFHVNRIGRTKKVNKTNDNS